MCLTILQNYEIKGFKRQINKNLKMHWFIYDKGLRHEHTAEYLSFQVKYRSKRPCDGKIAVDVPLESV